MDTSLKKDEVSVKKLSLREWLVLIFSIVSLLLSTFFGITLSFSVDTQNKKIDTINSAINETLNSVNTKLP